MADQHDGTAETLEFQNPLQTFLLKAQIADRQHFVDQQDLRIDMDGNRKPQPHFHAAAVAAHRIVDMAGQFGEIDDCRHPLLDFGQ